jgi:integrase
LVGVSLATARRKAATAREQLNDGVNPLDAKRADEQAQKAIPTFGEFALQLLTGSDAPSEADDAAGIEAGFSNAKHRQQWRNTLTTYAAPIWDMRVDTIDTAAVLKCLTPIWQRLPETASRVRGRIERVLNAAKAHGLRSGENPAAWRGHLDATLPRRGKLTRAHHAALAYDRMSDFMAELRGHAGTAVYAMEFLILTVCRMGEVLGARWAEIDLERAVWVIPAGRMKAGREHRIPLSARALAIVQRLNDLRAGEYVFPGRRGAEPLSTGAFDRLLVRMGRPDITTHGFRSSFRDWAGNETNFPRDIAEAALAHAVGDSTEQAYRRGDALEKRRAMMASWAQWCEPREADNVVPIHRLAAV